MLLWVFRLLIGWPRLEPICHHDWVQIEKVPVERRNTYYDVIKVGYSFVHQCSVCKKTKVDKIKWA
jgi:hypothetical protein